MNLSLKKKIDFFLGNTLIILLFPIVRLMGKILNKKHSIDQAKHVCFIKMIGGGSLILCLPTFIELKKQKKDLTLSLVCSKSIAGFAESTHTFDHILVIDDANLWTLLCSSLKVLYFLFKHADVTIDLEIHSRLTTLFTTFSMTHTRVGLINQNSLWRKRLYTHALFINPFAPIYVAYDAILALFKIEKISIDSVFSHWQSTGLQPTPTYANAIVLGTSCSELAPERQLDTELWADLISMLTKKIPDSQFVFLGSNDDNKIVQQIIEGLVAENNNLGIQSRVINLCGKTKLNESIAILKKARVFIGIDSALIHMARWSKVPSLGFWGPTAPEQRLRDIGLNEKHFYLKKSCSPCVHLAEPAPCGGYNLCMDMRPYLSSGAEWVQQAFNSTAPLKTNVMHKKSELLVCLPSGKKEFISVEVSK